MFSKLKNFSEDLAKTINQDLMVPADGSGPQSGNNVINQRRQNAAIKDLKNGAEVLHTETPDASELTQPEDVPEVFEERLSEPENEKKAPETDGVEKSESSPAPQTVPTSSGSAVIDIESLPTGIRSKMKKFAKYEEKYPILLDAYKTEKRKTDLIASFERILQEHTPVSSISDAGSLVEYLNGLNEKTNMLNQEFRKVAGDNSSLLKEKKQLESIKLVLEKARDSGKVEIDELQKKIKTLEINLQKSDENKNDGEVLELKGRVDELVKKLKEVEEEKNLMQAKFEEKKQEVMVLEGNIKERKEEVEKKENEIQTEVDKRVEVEEKVKADWKKEVEELNEKIQELQKEAESASISSKKIETTATVSAPPTPATGKSKNKKKNKKKGGSSDSATVGAAATMAEVETESTPEQTGVNDTASELTILQTKYDELLSEHDSLETKYLSTKSDLSLKNEDLEELRDLLKSIGNDLVRARDEIKELKLNSSSKEELDGLKKLNEDLTSTNKTLNATIEGQIEQINSFKSTHSTLLDDHKSLQASSTTLKSTIDSLKKEVDIVKQEKLTLNTRISELSKFKSNDSSLKLEISSLKVSISHKDQQISDLNSKISELAAVKKQQLQTIDTLTSGNQELQYSNKILINEKSELITKQELSFERAQLLSTELSKLQTEKHKVKTELDNIKNKYDLLLNEKSSSSEEIQSIKQQYDELTMKSKESFGKIESLEDDLNEARNMLQERTREASSIRRALLDLEDQNNFKASEFKQELKKWKEEKFEIENNCSNLIKRKQREIEESKSISSNYLLKILELEHKCNELKIQYEELKEQGLQPKSSNGHGNTGESIEDIQETIETLRNSLQTSTKRAKEYENLNNILKKLNEEANQKFERLSKNYKIVNQQYKQAKDDAHRKVSVSSNNSTEQLDGRGSIDNDVVSSPTKSTNGANSLENVAYLKNVLLGYFEHREQGLNFCQSSSFCLSLVLKMKSNSPKQ